MKKAEEVLASIAMDAKTHAAAPDAYTGYVEKVRKTGIDFVWKNGRTGRAETLCITLRRVVANRLKLENGRTWYSHTLDPFGEDVSFSETDKVAELMLKRHGLTPPASDL